MNYETTRLDIDDKPRTKKRKEMKKKLKKNQLESNSSETNRSHEIKLNSFESEDETVPIKRKKLHYEKKKVVHHLQEMQQVLGATKPPDEREAELERLLFGFNPDELSEVDPEESSEGEDEIVSEKTDKDAAPKLQPAWEDDDDETLLVKDKASTLKKCHRSILAQGEEKYSDFVQKKFTKLMGEPKWAELGRQAKDSDDDSDDELLHKTGNFIKASESLPKGTINIRKCPSLEDSSMKSALVKTIEFHPTSKVALVASTNGVVNLFQVDGKINAKIQSIYFEDYTIETAHFSKDGREFIVGSNTHAHLFTYDMFAGKILRVPEQRGLEQKNMRRFQMSPDGKYIVIHGRYGNMHLLTTKSKEWIGTLKMNGEVVAITFNNSGTRMYSHGTTGEVYIWDMMSRKCIHKFVDEGCLDGTALALSPNEQFFATGSDSGIVNVYNHSSLLTASNPEPLKTLKNLTTEVSHLKFNMSSEIMSMSSFRKKEAVKLVHFPSLTVFSNFPSRRENNSIRYTNSVDFSANSGYYGVGSNQGSAYIYRLKHYKNY